MSSLRLLLSGALVASGVVLGAFALAGSFDRHWPQKAGAATRTGPVEAFRTKTHFSTRNGERARPDAAAARGKLAQKRAEDRRAKGEERPKDPQQASLMWPWNWFAQ